MGLFRSQATEVARQHGFADVTHTIELFGTCTSH